VNLLTLGKEPWRFKYLEDQLNMYRQQWQADQKKQISRSRSFQIWLEICQATQKIEKEKIMKETITIPMVVAVAFARGIMAEEDTEDVEEAEEFAAEEAAAIVRI
jgi:hypothetical protein